MKIQSQCCTLEQSIRLKELGVTALSEYMHVSYDYNEICRTCEILHNIEAGTYMTDIKQILGQAYTVAELAIIPSKRADSGEMMSDALLDKYQPAIGNYLQLMVNPVFLADSLIDLLENNLITAEQVNEAINNA